MEEKNGSNLYEILLALRHNKVTRDELKAILATDAFPWVTLDFVPRPLRLVFLTARDQRRVADLSKYLENVLPEHVSYQLVESFHGVNAVVRGQLPSGWVPLKITAAHQFVGDAVEFEVTPVQRFRWRDIPAGETTSSGSHFSPSDARVEKALGEDPSFVRFLYNPTRLPIFPLYALIEPEDASGDHRKLLSDLLALPDFSEPVRDLFLIVERKEDINGDRLGPIFRKKKDDPERVCGIAVCEFIDLPQNGHPFQHSLEQFHRWRNGVLKELKGIRDIYCLPFIAARESYEGVQDPDLVRRIQSVYQNRLPFANPGYVEVREKTIRSLDLPIGDLVVCGASKSGRSMLAAWVCHQLLAAGYSVVYVAVTDGQAENGDHPVNQKSASLLARMISETGSLVHARYDDVTLFLNQSRHPLAVYTEIREDPLLTGEEPGTLLDWQKRSSNGKLFVMFDEITQEGPLPWIDRLQAQAGPERTIHLGFVCRNVDHSPLIKKLALSRATVIIKNLGKGDPFQKLANVDLAEALIKRDIERDKPLMPIGMDEMKDLDLLKSRERNFILFPRPKEGFFVPPVRGYLPNLSHLNRNPLEKIPWSRPSGADVEPQEEEVQETLQTSVLRAYDYDFFISYASEDRESVVEPLVKALRYHDIRYWYDVEQIGVGDIIPQKIEEGIAQSRFMMILLSLHYTEKKKEEDYVGLEWSAGVSRSRNVKLVPVVVGSKEVRDEILHRSPLTSGKRYIEWNDSDGSATVVRELLDLLKR